MTDMTMQQIQKEIGRLDQLRAALLEKTRGQDGIKALEQAQPMIEPGSKAHEALLATGYGMDKKKADFIIKDVDAKGGESRFPYDLYENAQAFLEAFGAKPVVISTRPPWRTRQRARVTGTV